MLAGKQTPQQALDDARRAAATRRFQSARSALTGGRGSPGRQATRLAGWPAGAQRRGGSATSHVSGAPEALAGPRRRRRRDLRAMDLPRRSPSPVHGKARPSFGNKLLPYVLLAAAARDHPGVLLLAGLQAAWTSFRLEDAFGTSSEFVGLENLPGPAAGPGLSTTRCGTRPCSPSSSPVCRCPSRCSSP